jgi:hypothetical protein
VSTYTVDGNVPWLHHKGIYSKEKKKVLSISMFNLTGAFMGIASCPIVFKGVSIKDS